MDLSRVPSLRTTVVVIASMVTPVLIARLRSHAIGTAMAADTRLAHWLEGTALAFATHIIQVIAAKQRIRAPTCAPTMEGQRELLIRSMTMTAVAIVMKTGRVTIASARCHVMMIVGRMAP